MGKLTEQDKTAIQKSNFEAILLDISIDVQNELLQQCSRVGCDDFQTGIINTLTMYVFELNKEKYVKRLMENNGK